MEYLQRCKQTGAHIFFLKWRLTIWLDLQSVPSVLQYFNISWALKLSACTKSYKRTFNGSTRRWSFYLRVHVYIIYIYINSKMICIYIYMWLYVYIILWRMMHKHISLVLGHLRPHGCNRRMDSGIFRVPWVCCDNVQKKNDTLW